MIMSVGRPLTEKSPDPSPRQFVKMYACFRSERGAGAGAGCVVGGYGQTFGAFPGVLETKAITD